MKLITIGSGDNVHIKLNSPFVSGYHAELLLLDNGEILLTDKGSKNGTFLEDQRLQPNKDIPVKRGDNIRVADQLLDWQNVPNMQMPDISKIKEMRGIGTNFRNKYQLQGDAVSRFHATLTKKSDKKWYIQDHSKNGTTINGQKIASNQDIRIKRGDKIECAGVPVPNPCGAGSAVNYKKILTVIAIILLICGVIFGIYALVKNLPKSSSSSNISAGSSQTSNVVQETMPDKEIFAKYKNSTSMIIGFYYYRVSAGNLDLDKIGLPTMVVMNGSKIEEVKNQDDMNIYSGTGFFISKDGKVATNRHIARPWMYDDSQTSIRDQFKMLLATVAQREPRLNAYLDQVKVEGVLHYIGVIPNGSIFSDANMVACREFACEDNADKDVAILQLETKRLPHEECTYIDLDEAVTDEESISVGAHMYTIGFPFSVGSQDLSSSKGIQAWGNGGDITKESTEFLFSFNAPSYHGASGSPVFNEYGRLIGVLRGGKDESQGFNNAVKIKCLIELLNKFKSK